jgi:3-dehydroquinate synthase
MDRQEIRVNLGERSYSILVTSGELGRVGVVARSLCQGTQALVICDQHTEQPFAEQAAQALSAEGFNAMRVCLAAGERTKSLDSAADLYGRLIGMAADRGTLVVAVGGGVIGDLAGFVAATYARGLPFFQIPTSLLAQVDSSVGGKVAVNYHDPNGRITKNMIGAFHQPLGVLIDTETLQTLPREELRSGLAEVVKYGVILDAELFAFLEGQAEAVLALDPMATRHVITRSCAIKARVVEADERELTDCRAMLNYGHTFAHAIEAVSPQFRHGEAVALGMVAASRLAELLGRAGPELTERQVALLERFGLPTSAGGLDIAVLRDVMQRDKKSRAGRLRFVLPSRIGAAELVGDVEPAALETILRRCFGG